jgi:replicative DNA helicase
LLRLAVQAGCEGGAVVIDSIKDVVPKISSDESGGAFNGAMQLCIVNGIDVLSLHHPRKGNQENKRTKLSLDDVYGSTWVTAGQGSVIALNGIAGTGTAAFSHLKQPADEISGFDVSFDYDLGTVTTIGNRDIREYLSSLQGRGVSTAQVVGFVTRGTSYTEATRKRVLRRLNRLAEYGDINRSGDAVPLWSVTYIDFGGHSPDTPRTPRTDTPPDTPGHARPVPW